MGIPYSREINAAFEQVTPLVAAGFKVLTTMKNISVLLAVIQILTVLCLMAILAVLLAIVYCVNPDLEVRGLTLSPTTSIPFSRSRYLFLGLLTFTMHFHKKIRLRGGSGREDWN
jgi:hypothetical protein